MSCVQPFVVPVFRWQIKRVFDIIAAKIYGFKRFQNYNNGRDPEILQILFKLTRFDNWNVLYVPLFNHALLTRINITNQWSTTTPPGKVAV